MRIDRNACMHAQAFYLLNVAMQVSAGFKVYGKVICPCFFEIRNIFIRIHNHEVHIKRLCRDFFYCAYYRQSKRNIRYKYSIHHIKVKPPCFAFIYHANGSAKLCKICRKK